MNFAPILSPALSVVYWLIPFALIAIAIKSPWLKGILGETLVKLWGRLRLSTDEYHRIHNVTLQTPDGTTQIDHVFVSRFGIFVVETKNMQGWIFGGAYQAQWTQRLYKNSFKFQNPLRQNYKHVKALESLLDVPADTIHSVVVFAGNSTFKTPMPANFTNAGGYIRHIKSFQIPLLTESQVQAAVSQIQSGRLTPTRETHRQHVQQLKARNNSNTDKLCPKCGSAMLKRTSQRGANAGKQFWGCSAFPRCKTTKPIT